MPGCCARSAEGRTARIRTFDSIVSTLGGGRSFTEALGLEPAALVVIETDAGSALPSAYWCARRASPRDRCSSSRVGKDFRSGRPRLTGRVHESVELVVKLDGLRTGRERRGNALLIGRGQAQIHVRGIVDDAGTVQDTQDSEYRRMHGITNTHADSLALALTPPPSARSYRDDGRPALLPPAE
jgi:hypothetical protein